MNADNSSNNDQTSQATILLSLENLIKSNISGVDKLRDELKKHREMLEDSCANDPVFKEHEEKAKEAAKVKTSTKQQIFKQPSVAALSQKVKEISSEIKERQNSLSDYLKEYQRMTGANEIEGEDGEIREIIAVLKVVKRTSRKNS